MANTEVLPIDLRCHNNIVGHCDVRYLANLPIITHALEDVTTVSVAHALHFVFSRGFDVVSPLLHELTYQVSCYQVLKSSYSKLQTLMISFSHSRPWFTISWASRRTFTRKNILHIALVDSHTSTYIHSILGL